MKLKYYLRGLGIGIVITAIIMSFTRQPEKLTDAQIKMKALELGMVEENVLVDLQEDAEMVSNEGKDTKDKIPAFEDIVNVEEEDESNSQEVPEAGESQESTEDNSETKDNQESIENNSEAESDLENVSDIEENTESDSMAEESNVSGIELDIEESKNSADGVDSNNSTEIMAGEVVENYIIISVEGGNGSEIVSRKLYEAGLVNSAIEFNQYLVKNGYDRKLKVGNHEIPADATEEEMAKILCGMY